MFNCFLCLFVLGADVHLLHGSICQTPKHIPACRSEFSSGLSPKEQNLSYSIVFCEDDKHNVLNNFVWTNCLGFRLHATEGCTETSDLCDRIGKGKGDTI